MPWPQPRVETQLLRRRTAVVIATPDLRHIRQVRSSAPTLSGRQATQPHRTADLQAFL